MDSVLPQSTNEQPTTTTMGALETAVTIAGFVIKYGVPAFIRLIEICKKPDPTIEDWLAVFSITKKSYDDYLAGK